MSSIFQASLERTLTFVLTKHWSTHHPVVQHMSSTCQFFSLQKRCFNSTKLQHPPYATWNPTGIPSHSWRCRGHCRYRVWFSGCGHVVNLELGTARSNLNVAAIFISALEWIHNFGVSSIAVSGSLNRWDRWYIQSPNFGNIYHLYIHHI